MKQVWFIFKCIYLRKMLYPKSDQFCESDFTPNCNVLAKMNHFFFLLNCVKIGACSLLGSVKSTRARSFVPFQLSPEICFCTPPKAFCKWCLTHPVTVIAALFPGFSVNHPGNAVQGIAELPVKHSVSYWGILLMTIRKYQHSQIQSLLHHTAWRKCASFLARAEKAKPYTAVCLSHCQGWTSALQLVIQPLKTPCEQPRALAWLGSCICFVPEWEITLSEGDGCRLAGSTSEPAARWQQHMGLPAGERKPWFLLTWIFCAIIYWKELLL